MTIADSQPRTATDGRRWTMRPARPTDARALAAANPSARFLAIEGMNHILKSVSGGLMEQQPKYSDPTLPVVPQLLDEMAAFVRSARKKV